MNEIPANLAATVAEIQRVLNHIAGGDRPDPAAVQIVRAAERRGHIRRDEAARRFVLTDSGRQLAGYTQSGEVSHRNVEEVRHG